MLNDTRTHVQSSWKHLTWSYNFLPDSNLSLENEDMSGKMVALFIGIENFIDNQGSNALFVPLVKLVVIWVLLVYSYVVSMMDSTGCDVQWWDDY
jgi:hypothetical protein